MQEIDDAVSAALGHDVAVRRVTSPIDPADLHPAESLQYKAFQSSERQRHWLLGRTALKLLLPVGADTSSIAFPHPSLSVTHAPDVAFAARIEGVRGTGIDFERSEREPDPRTARFFLHPQECSAASRPEQLLRLWTVKESLYKATPRNQRAVLLDYRLDDPHADVGTAAGPAGERLRYATVVAPDGFLTVAVCVDEERTADVAL